MTDEYTPETRKLLAAAFKAALKYLAKSSSEMLCFDKKRGICACLATAGDAGEISERIQLMATDIIMERLGDHCYYHNWVADKVGPITVRLDMLTNDSRKIQDGRRRWLKSLIKEFSS